jgi:DNA-binding LacI/PurR family transcriptional regulator
MKNKHNYLYMDIIERIKADTHHLPAHTRIDTRNVMMTKYNATRTTIEKAISALIGEKYLYAIDGSGTYIAEPQIVSSYSQVAAWGVILPNIVSDTYPDILRGIEDVAQQNNINVIICNTDHDRLKQEQYILKLVASGINGVIVIPAITELPATDSFQPLLQDQIPLVFCNRGVDGVTAPRVISNNYFGAYIATKHLINLQYTRLAYIGGRLYSGSEQRYQGFLGAIHEAGLPVDKEFIVFHQLDLDSEKSGYEAGLALLGKSNSPDAILCFNDRIAQGVYRAAEQLGLTVGADFGIVGYDDSRICELLPVKLTSIRYPKYETGHHAATILLRMTQGEAVSSNEMVVLQPELIVRQSC